MNTITAEIESHWAVVAPLLSIHNESEYDRAVERLNDLLDEVGTDEAHPLYGLLDALGAVMHTYEEDHYPIAACSGIDVVRFLIEEHGLGESDLPEIGSPAVVSELLNGKRELNVK